MPRVRIDIGEIDRIALLVIDRSFGHRNLSRYDAGDSFSSATATTLVRVTTI